MVWGRNEADTCRDLVVPAIEAAGWAPDQVIEQLQLQNPDAQHAHVAPGGTLRIADYVLTIGGVPLVVVEAKREYRAPGDGIQQGVISQEIGDSSASGHR